MFRTTLLALFGALISVSFAEDFTEVLPIWVSRQNTLSGPSETRYFRAHLCGGCVYDKRKATVSINFPSQFWNESNGNILTVSIISSSDKEIASNVIGGKKHVSEFSFLYSVAYSDLLLKVTSGTAISFTYKFVISFGVKLGSTKPLCMPRFAMTRKETFENREFNRVAILSTSNDVTDFIPMFRVEKKGSVKTDSFIGYQLDYCFPSDLPYSFTISVVAADDTSAFSTFVCPYNGKACSVESEFNDLSGWSDNFVTAIVSSEDSIGPVKVLVKGDGRFGQNNTFQLVPSTIYKSYE